MAPQRVDIGWWRGGHYSHGKREQPETTVNGHNSRHEIITSLTICHFMNTIEALYCHKVKGQNRIVTKDNMFQHNASLFGRSHRCTPYRSRPKLIEWISERNAGCCLKEEWKEDYDYHILYSGPNPCT